MEPADSSFCNWFPTLLLSFPLDYKLQGLLDSVKYPQCLTQCRAWSKSSIKCLLKQCVKCLCSRESWFHRGPRCCLGPPLFPRLRDLLGVRNHTRCFACTVTAHSPSSRRPLRKLFTDECRASINRNASSVNISWVVFFFYHQPIRDTTWDPSHPHGLAKNKWDPHSFHPNPTVSPAIHTLCRHLSYLHLSRINQASLLSSLRKM